LIREVLAEKASNAKEEREILEQKLYLLEKQKEPMVKKLEEVERFADRSARRALWSLASVFVTQFALVQYGTFIAFSWDIMEPFTCGMTLFDTLFGYLFWIRSGRPYSLDGLREHFF
jgi:hypothetical protein